MTLLCVVLMSALSAADGEAQASDAGAPPDGAALVDAGAELTPAVAAPSVPSAPAVAASVDAGTPKPPAPGVGYHGATILWGPGRRSSGETFKSVAEHLPDGPLRWRWGDFSAAVGGQVFVRTEARNNADLRDAAGDGAFTVDERARAGLRLSAKDRIGALIELQDVRTFGTEPTTLGVMANTGLHQGFVDAKLTPWLDLRVGRQELQYGDDRLVGSVDWAQPGRAFNGLFLRASAGTLLTVDAFGMLVKAPGWVTPDAAVGGSRFFSPGTTFTGAYARLRFGKAGVDVYSLNLFEDPSTAAAGQRRTNARLTFGGRAFGALGPLVLVGEGAFQTGWVGGAVGYDTVVAGALAAKATVTLPVWSAPYVMGEFSAASGDGDGTDRVERTFHPLFPTAHIHLGFMDYVAWQNVVAGRLSAGFRPFGAHVWVDVHHFRAWDPKGTWFAANGTAFLGPDAARTASGMGTELDFNFTVPLAEPVALSGAFATFLPGDMAAAKGTQASVWGFLYVRAQL